MTLKQVMKALASMGTAQNRKVYQRHGYGENLFGVSFADLKTLAKKIGVDHDLALELWESGNDDARILATMVADAEAMSSRDLDRWAKTTQVYVIADCLAGSVAGRSPHARKKLEAWCKSKDEFVGQAGWDLVAGAALSDDKEADGFFAAKLETIEAGIHAAKNRTRHAMNNALIAIGMRTAKLRKKAEAAAKRIGKVEVDHGETSCRTPDAIPYIARAWEHKKKMARRAGGRKKAGAGKSGKRP